MGIGGPTDDVLLHYPNPACFQPRYLANQIFLFPYQSLGVLLKKDLCHYLGLEK